MFISVLDVPEIATPCMPNPCGPNSICRPVNSQSVCSCMPNYVGVPPECRPECVISSECAANKACVNQKCIDPCPGHCGSLNTNCRVINHSPICSCTSGFTGDPFTRCYSSMYTICMFTIITGNIDNMTCFNDCFFFAVRLQNIPEPYKNPCIPNPCGANSICREINGAPSCTCLPEYFGLPPNCKPECAINQDCPANKACMNMKCRDPCPGSCGQNTICTVFNHSPACSCSQGFTGDPFTRCVIIEPIQGKILEHNV